MSDPFEQGVGVCYKSPLKGWLKVMMFHILTCCFGCLCNRDMTSRKALWEKIWHPWESTRDEMPTYTPYIRSWLYRAIWGNIWGTTGEGTYMGGYPHFPVEQKDKKTRLHFGLGCFLSELKCWNSGEGVAGL